mmetsp:Transcript_4520/g.9083  ORF Transcript_4520/g.9083 Transcript_4520/m.9083 type:complete len:532 (-) Transcript_4520:16-1611(-)
MDSAGKKISKDAPIAGQSQARAHLAVKTGGFSIGAFAASNRGKVTDFYVVEKKVIGEGSYGSVQRCQFKDTGQWRALKAINKALVKNAEQFKEEMAIMKLLDHPNIVRLYETFEDEKLVYLVLELCTGGELFDRIVAEEKFSEQAAAICVQQMLRAVNYMHQNYIMHRDLKPENWLLSSSTEALQQADLKLIDFGLSKRFSPGEFATTKAGTPYYVAPEVLAGRYAEQSDVWSIGVIMYILLCGSPPFAGNDTVAVLESVKRAQPTFDKKEWMNVSPEAKLMLKALLQREPTSRMSASDALQHQWISKAMQSSCEDQANITNGIVTNLKCFSVMNKLKKASLNVIATQLTDNAIRELKEMFMAMDENNDGTLSVGELKEGLEKAGVAIPPDLQVMMDNIDTDGSGVIDYSEFMAATMDKRRYIQEDVCWRAFKTFDVDGSGTIDKYELMKLLGVDSISNMMEAQVTEKEVDAIMREVDLNGDGKIDFSEFLTMMRRMPSRPRRGSKSSSMTSSRRGEIREHLNIGIGSTKP